MNVISVLVVDDEAPARRKLLRYLEKDDRFRSVGEAVDGEDAILKIETLRPDLLLLDIQMPLMNGFDVVRLLQDPIPDVIFTTAYDQYAVDAFDVSAVDYLLKPIAEMRLRAALDRVVAGRRTRARDVLEHLETNEYLERLPVRHLKRVKLLAVNAITYIHSEHRLVHVYDNQQAKFWTNETLDQLERRLSPDQFFRIHRSSIINLGADFEIEPWDDGRLKIHFADTALTVAREPAGKLRQKLAF